MNSQNSTLLQQASLVLRLWILSLVVSALSLVFPIHLWSISPPPSLRKSLLLSCTSTMMKWLDSYLRFMILTPMPNLAVATTLRSRLIDLRSTYLAELHRAILSHSCPRPHGIKDSPRE